jgi:ferredoxin
VPGRPAFDVAQARKGPPHRSNGHGPTDGNQGPPYEDIEGSAGPEGPAYEEEGRSEGLPHREDDETGRPEGLPHDSTAEEEAAAPGRLTLVVSGRSGEVAPGESLLEAAERLGADIPSVCRSGVCGTCRTRLVSGQVQCTSDELTDEDRAAGYVLPCVTWAEEDCELEA